MLLARGRSPCAIVACRIGGPQAASASNPPAGAPYHTRACKHTSFTDQLKAGTLLASPQLGWRAAGASVTPPFSHCRASSSQVDRQCCAGAVLCPGGAGMRFWREETRCFCSSEVFMGLLFVGGFHGEQRRTQIMRKTPPIATILLVGRAMTVNPRILLCTRP